MAQVLPQKSLKVFWQGPSPLLCWQTTCGLLAAAAEYVKEAFMSCQAVLLCTLKASGGDGTTIQQVIRRLPPPSVGGNNQHLLHHTSCSLIPSWFIRHLTLTQ
jgi:hypothetical protein